uniref:Centromere protein X n=1 Tax=Oncorhynchus kisutch TaxID=8019 RepID=A0A8C7N518_ONCKI
MAESSAEVTFKKSLLRVALGIQTLTLCFSEAAQRTIKQAEAEDCDRMDIEHFEKILPQLVCKYTMNSIKYPLLLLSRNDSIRINSHNIFHFFPSCWISSMTSGQKMAPES